MSLSPSITFTHSPNSDCISTSLISTCHTSANKVYWLFTDLSSLTIWDIYSTLRTVTGIRYQIYKYILFLIMFSIMTFLEVRQREKKKTLTLNWLEKFNLKSPSMSSSKVRGTPCAGLKVLTSWLLCCSPEAWAGAESINMTWSLV